MRNNLLQAIVEDHYAQRPLCEEFCHYLEQKTLFCSRFHHLLLYFRIFHNVQKNNMSTQGRRESAVEMLAYRTAILWPFVYETFKMGRQKMIMKKGLVWFFFGFFALCFTSGCATLIDGSSQFVTFKSMPNGVTVTANGKSLGETPLVVKLERQLENVVEFNKEGYTKQSVPMKSRLNGLVWVNAIWCLSCILSTTTDFASGAAYHYAPDKYFVIMVPEGVTETASDTKKRKVKSFIMGNYTEILSTLSKIPDDLTLEDYFSSGYGEHLDSLITLLEIPDPDRKKATYKIKKISRNTADSLNFSDEVLNAFPPSDSTLSNEASFDVSPKKDSASEQE